MHNEVAPHVNNVLDHGWNSREAFRRSMRCNNYMLRSKDGDEIFAAWAPFRRD